MRYFSKFPIVNYNNQFVRNITNRVKVFAAAKKETTIYYPYSIREGERPDTIAYNYYGNSQYFWVIFIVNDIVDPYYDWPMTQRLFNRYVAAKYGSLSESQSEVIHYRRADTDFYLHNLIPDVIITRASWLALPVSEQSKYTLQKYTSDVFVSPGSYLRMSTEDKALFQAVYAYDYEFTQNESRREIKLLDLKYLSHIEDDLVRLLRE